MSLGSQGYLSKTFKKKKTNNASRSPPPLFEETSVKGVQ